MESTHLSLHSHLSIHLRVYPLTRSLLTPQFADDEWVRSRHDADGNEIEHDGNERVVKGPRWMWHDCYVCHRIHPLNGRPCVPTPDLDVVRPEPWELFSVEEEWGGDSDWCNPDKGDEWQCSTLSQMRLHCEDDAEEPVACDEGECQHTGHEWEHWKDMGMRLYSVILLKVPHTVTYVTHNALCEYKDV